MWFRCASIRYVMLAQRSRLVLQERQEPPVLGHELNRSTQGVLDNRIDRAAVLGEEF